MARTARTVYEITDDLTGKVISEEEAVHVAFTYEGVEYEIDLGQKNATKFDEVLRPYIEAGRRVGGRKKASGAPKRNLEVIRSWARANGHTVSDRGRIPNAVVEAYEAAH